MGLVTETGELGDSPRRAFCVIFVNNVLLSAEERLDGRYRVSKLLGRGGMGEVWAGERLADKHPVALKVLLERAACRKGIKQRFAREAEVTARIDSPFVCPLLDQGFAQDGSMFLVFELLRGETLADRLRREIFLPFDEVAPLMIDVFHGVHDAHQAKVLHRDLKPGNIFIKPEKHRGETAVILDFGVSKIIQSVQAQEESSLTAYDGTVGSFAYMAPEQVRGAARVDERADVYGVASVAFRAMTGRLPFEGSSARMMASLKLDNHPPTLTEATGVLWPQKIEEFFALGLSRDPNERFESAQSAGEHLASVLAFTRQVRHAAARR
ncbi:MAG: hypothetical protein CSA75_02935 [Sorangium cellulosum]|nr:MAG: hypothetical protein CSA75_02935 [Sorangium cellulosum]